MAEVLPPEAVMQAVAPADVTVSSDVVPEGPEETRVPVPSTTTDIQIAKGVLPTEPEETSIPVPLSATEVHKEEHLSGGDLIKSIIFGGLDAVINSESTVAAVYGGGLSSHIALTLGIANLVADGIAMALGDYISSKAEFELAVQERKREVWEMNNSPEGEKSEMIELLVGKGLEKPDAVRIIDIFAKHKEFFVDFMMIEELGMDVPDDPWGPVKDGLVMMCSYTVFGTIPLLPYVFAEAGQYTASAPLFGASIAATLFSLACLGLVQGVMTGQPLVKSALYMFFNGGIAAGAALLIGWGLSQATGGHGC